MEKQKPDITSWYVYNSILNIICAIFIYHIRALPFFLDFYVHMLLAPLSTIQYTAAAYLTVTHGNTYKGSVNKIYVDRAAQLKNPARLLPQKNSRIPMEQLACPSPTIHSLALNVASTTRGTYHLVALTTILIWQYMSRPKLHREILNSYLAANMLHAWIQLPLMNQQSRAEQSRAIELGLVLAVPCSSIYHGSRNERESAVVQCSAVQCIVRTRGTFTVTTQFVIQCLLLLLYGDTHFPSSLSLSLFTCKRVRLFTHSAYVAMKLSIMPCRLCAS